MSRYDKITKTKATKACREADSKSQMARNLGVTSINGSVIRGMDTLISKYKLDISHFDAGASRKIIHERITKTCPICGEDFETTVAGKLAKETCSYSCANSYFRSGENHSHYKDGTYSYRNVCFKAHGKECIICGEKRAVAVHHYDGNRKNNDPNNLVPLCPTHHQYWHSKYKKLIEEKVENFIKSLK